MHAPLTQSTSRACRLSRSILRTKGRTFRKYRREKIICFVSFHGVIASPEMKRSLQELDRTLGNTERLTHDARMQVGPLFASITSAAAQLKATIALLGSDPRSSNDLLRTLTELKDAARSIRLLADYLERHPESLLRGKPQEASR